MLYTKDGYPEANEIVKCTVKKIYGNTTFVSLDEYDKEGVLTISEIAPGRIRNLREHVVENKVIICKVLRIDEKNERIDVSLRRVPIPVMKEKLEEIKMEEFADKLYIDTAKVLGITKDELFEKTYEEIFEEYETVFAALYDIMIDNSKIEMFKNLSKNEKEVFVKIINDKIKPEEVFFKKKFKIFSGAEEGVLKIKAVIAKSLEGLDQERIKIYYLSAGTFSINIRHDDMKLASSLYEQFRKNIEKEAKEEKVEVSIEAS